MRSTPTPTRITTDRLAPYFAGFTGRFLNAGIPETVTVEVISNELGAQTALVEAPLLEIVYDPHARLLEIGHADGDHRIADPLEVWVVEAADGFIELIDVTRAEGGHEIISLRRAPRHLL